MGTRDDGGGHGKSKHGLLFQTTIIQLRLPRTVDNRTSTRRLFFLHVLRSTTNFSLSQSHIRYALLRSAVIDRARPEAWAPLLLVAQQNLGQEAKQISAWTPHRPEADHWTHQTRRSNRQCFHRLQCGETA